jgi:uncharacterized protein
MKSQVLQLIRWYQRNLSPDHSPRKVNYPAGYCRYYPSCSEYSHQAIDRHGVIRGGVLAMWRVLRCNPFSKGGVDPVPDRKPVRN